jgi:hypothetical protein
MKFAVVNFFACLSVAAAFRPVGMNKAVSVRPSALRMQSEEVATFQPFDFKIEERNADGASAVAAALVAGLMLPTDAYANEYGMHH